MHSKLTQPIFLFDLDGTLYRGSAAVKGAAHVLSALRAMGKECRFISNNSTHSASQLAEKLTKMGIPAQPHEFITPLIMAGRYLKERFGICRVFVLGNERLVSAVTEKGHLAVRKGEPCDTVLVGRDLEINYQKLETAAAFVQRGARLIACNTDFSHPGEEGFLVPETGAFLAALRTVVPAPYEEIGKPAPYLFACAGITPADCAMVGDNKLTDIAGGKNAGCATVLIGGKADDENIVIDSLIDLLAHVQR